MHVPRHHSLLLGIALSLVALIGGSMIAPTAVHAAQPQHINFSGTATNVNLCGINTTLAYSGVDNFTPSFDASGNLVFYKDLHQETDTYTAANGRSITIRTAGVNTGTFTTNLDGTFTQVFTDNGLQAQIQTSNGPVLTKDVGVIVFTWLYDSGGTFISLTTNVVAGPHPIATSPDFALFCQVVTSALS